MNPVARSRGPLARTQETKSFQRGYTYFVLLVSPQRIGGSSSNSGTASFAYKHVNCTKDSIYAATLKDSNQVRQYPQVVAVGLVYTMPVKETDLFEIAYFSPSHTSDTDIERDRTRKWVSSMGCEAQVGSHLLPNRPPPKLGGGFFTTFLWLPPAVFCSSSDKTTLLAC